MQARQHTLRPLPLMAGSLKILSANVYFFIASYAVIIILARKLHVHDFGLYALAISILAWLELILSNGFNAPYIRALSTRNYDSFRKISLFHLISIIFTVTALFIGSSTLGLIFSNNDLSLILKIAALDIIPYCLYQRSLVILNVQGKYWSCSFSFLAYSTFKAVFMISGVLLFASVEAAIMGMVLGSTLAALFSWIMTLCSPADILAGNTRQSIYRAQTNLWQGIMLTTGIGIFMAADIWVLQLTGASQENLGLYGAAHNLTKTIYLGAFAMTLPLFPVFAAHGSFQKAFLQEKQVKGVLWVMSGGLLAVPVIIMFSPAWLMALFFGEEYVFGARFLFVLAPVHAVITAALVLNQILFQTNELKGVGLQTLLAALVFIPFGFLTGKHLGLDIIPVCLGSVAVYLFVGNIIRLKKKTCLLN